MCALPPLSKYIFYGLPDQTARRWLSMYKPSAIDQAVTEEIPIIYQHQRESCPLYKVTTSSSSGFGPNWAHMKKICQEYTFRAFPTFITIGDSQYKFLTTSWKSNHWYKIIPVQKENKKVMMKNYFGKQINCSKKI